MPQTKLEGILKNKCKKEPFPLTRTHALPLRLVLPRQEVVGTARHREHLHDRVERELDGRVRVGTPVARRLFVHLGDSVGGGISAGNALEGGGGGEEGEGGETAG